MIAERYRCSGCCVTGKDHLKKNTVCQDRTFSYAKNGVYAISLSDGAGSKKESHHAAEILTESVSKYIVEHFDDLSILLENKGKESIKADKDKHKVIELILGHLDMMLNKCVIEEKIDYSELASTLLFVGIKEDRFIAGHIGDGVIGMVKTLSGEQKLSVLSKPENGDQPNITFFVNNKDASEHFRIYSGSMSGVRGFILMSDGPEEVLYSKYNGLDDNCLILFNAINGTSRNNYDAFLKSILEKKISEISYDDLSINIIFKETIDLSKNVDNELLEDFFDGLFDSQITQISSYSVFIDRSKQESGNQMSSNDRIKELTRRLG